MHEAVVAVHNSRRRHAKGLHNFRYSNFFKREIAVRISATKCRFCHATRKAAGQRRNKVNETGKK